MNIPDWIKPAAWGAVLGAVALAIVGFSAGWVVSQGRENGGNPFGKGDARGHDADLRGAVQQAGRRGPTTRLR